LLELQKYNNQTTLIKYLNALSKKIKIRKIMKNKFQNQKNRSI
jgi:hypothetical protein